MKSHFTDEKEEESNEENKPQNGCGGGSSLGPGSGYVSKITMASSYLNSGSMRVDKALSVTRPGEKARQTQNSQFVRKLQQCKSRFDDKVAYSNDSNSSSDYVDENFECDDIDEKIEQQGTNVLNMDCHPMCIQKVSKQHSSHRELYPQSMNKVLFCEDFLSVKAQ